MLTTAFALLLAAAMFVAAYFAVREAVSLVGRQKRNQHALAFQTAGSVPSGHLRKKHNAGMGFVDRFRDTPLGTFLFGATNPKIVGDGTGDQDVHAFSSQPGIDFEAQHRRRGTTDIICGGIDSGGAEHALYGTMRDGLVDGGRTFREITGGGGHLEDGGRLCVLMRNGGTAGIIIDPPVIQTGLPIDGQRHSFKVGPDQWGHWRERAAA